MSFQSSSVFNYLVNKIEKNTTVIEETNTSTAAEKWSSARSNIREESVVSEFVKQSSQACSVDINKLKLKGYLGSTKSDYVKRCINGLLSVIEILEHSDFLTVDDAYDIFASFFENQPDKDTFKRKLLDKDVGLCCCLVTNPHTLEQIVIMKGIVGNSARVFQRLTTTFKDSEMKANYPKLSSDLVEKLISSMDTEYDRKCAKIIVGTISPSEYRYTIN